MSLLRANDRILFQGDSITDVGWRESHGGPLGTGYVAMVAGLLAARRPELPVEILNRGISGDRTVELLARWQVDCLDLKPQVLSIQIGVNDVWRKEGEWQGQTYVPLPAYQANLKSLCNQARSGGVRDLVLMNPATLGDSGSPLDTLLGDYAAWVGEYAREIGACFVDVRTPLLRARIERPKVPWAPDGVHPSTAGHALIAAAWVEAILR